VRFTVFLDDPVFELFIGRIIQIVSKVVLVCMFVVCGNPSVVDEVKTKIESLFLGILGNIVCLHFKFFTDLLLVLFVNALGSLVNFLVVR
jgi:hypothetical protein